MEQRSIMSLGRSSLVISLPKHWVKLNELKSGDAVSVAVQRDRSLVVFPGVKSKERTKEITLHVDPNEKNVFIVRKIIACYLNGYSNIKLVSKKIFSVAQQKAIRDIARQLYMRIMEAGTKKIHIVTLMDELKAQIISGIQRMHTIAKSMLQDALNALKNQDEMLARAVYSLDDDVDHFSFFLIRLLRSAALDTALANKLDLKPIEGLDYQNLVQRIEYAADEAANIAKHIIMLSQRQQKLSDSLLELMLIAGNYAFSLYNKAMDAFFSKDVTSSNEIIEGEKRSIQLDEKIASLTFLTKEMDSMTVCAVCSIRESITEIADDAKDIAEITINRSYS